MPVMVILVCSIILVTGCSGTGESTAPNIILLISDDQGWTDYSFMGHEYIQTPRIDQLAAEGLTFTQGYTTAPLCRPALASMATGLYPHQHRVLGNDPVHHAGTEPDYSEGWLDRRAPLNRSVVDAFDELSTLADLLGDAGYVSLQTGKWWEGHFSMGGFSMGMTHGDPTQGGRHGDEGLKIGREGLDLIFDFIDRSGESGSPFYIWFAPLLPHAPHSPPDSLRKKYLSLAPSPAVANYWAMCEWFDYTCGQLMDYVEQKGLSENTLFVYVTDNGWIQDPDQPNQYAPRSKREPYNMGIRTPVIYRRKGVIEPRMDETTLSSSIDIATTVLAACGIEPVPGMQGINMLDEQARKARDAIFAETYTHDFTTIDSSLCYRIIITRPWKLILPDPHGQPGKEPELYHLDEDPFEWENRAGDHPEIVSELRQRIERWWDE
jgi:uncharacterized sulfatase